MAVNDFPDGCVAPERFLPNPPAPEALLPQLHGEAQFYGGPPGLQPITAVNPNGSYPGKPFSAHS
jgi:hypothetical protein